MPRNEESENNGDKTSRTIEQAKVFDNIVSAFLNVIEETHQAYPNLPLEEMTAEMLSAYKEANRIYLIRHLKINAPYINLAEVEKLLD